MYPGQFIVLPSNTLCSINTQLGAFVGQVRVGRRITREARSTFDVVIGPKPFCDRAPAELKGKHYRHECASRTTPISPCAIRRIMFWFNYKLSIKLNCQTVILTVIYTHLCYMLLCATRYKRNTGAEHFYASESVLNSIGLRRFLFFFVGQIVQMDIPDTGHRRTHTHINIRTRARFPSSFTCMPFLFHCACTSVCVHVCHLIYERNAIAPPTRKILRHNIVVVFKCACLCVANVNNRVTRLSRNVQKY